MLTSRIDVIRLHQCCISCLRDQCHVSISCMACLIEELPEMSWDLVLQMVFGLDKLSFKWFIIFVDGFIDMIDMIIYLKHFSYTQKNKQNEICIFNSISKYKLHSVINRASRLFDNNLYSTVSRLTMQIDPWTLFTPFSETRQNVVYVVLCLRLYPVEKMFGNNLFSPAINSLLILNAVRFISSIHLYTFSVISVSFFFCAMVILWLFLFCSV